VHWLNETPIAEIAATLVEVLAPVRLNELLEAVQQLLQPPQDAPGAPEAPEASTEQSGNDALRVLGTNLTSALNAAFEQQMKICRTCEREFQAPMQRGQPPKRCPECRGPRRTVVAGEQQAVAAE
jgi:hypothetical protein